MKSLLASIAVVYMLYCAISHEIESRSIRSSSAQQSRLWNPFERIDYIDEPFGRVPVKKALPVPVKVNQPVVKPQPTVQPVKKSITPPTITIERTNKPKPPTEDRKLYHTNVPFESLNALERERALFDKLADSDKLYLSNLERGKEKL